MRRLLRNCMLTVLVLSSVAATGTIQTSETPIDRDLQLEIPQPNLSSLQPAARQRIETLQDSLEVQITTGELTALQLREGFGFLGQMFHAFELLDAAEICYQNAATLSPEDVRWAYYLGLVTNSKGDLEKAVDQYRLALELGAAELAPLIRLGNVLLDLGRAEEAGGYFEKALEQDPESAAAEFGLGRVAALEGKTKQAIDYFEQVLTQQPEASAVHYPLAQAYRASGDRDAAARHLAQQGGRRVSFPDPLATTVTSIGKSTALEVVGDLAKEVDGFSEESFLGFVLSQFSNVQGSEEQLIKMLDFLEDSADSTELQRARVAYAVGGLLVLRGRDDDAIPYFEKAVAGDPNLRDAHVKLGNTLARGERFEGALEQYDRALALRGDDPEVLMKRATALVNLDRLPEARTTVEKAVELAPGRGSSWVLLAEIQGRQDESQTAIESFGKAIAAARDAEEQMSFHVALGDFYRDQEQFESAATEYLQALRIDDGYVPALDPLATLLGGLGYYEQAAEVYRKWTIHEPDSASVWLSEATFLILAEKYSTARNRLQEALKVLPENLDLKDVLARHLAACPDQSVRNGTRAVELAREVYSTVPSQESIETLAMALAEDGQFEEAIAWQNQLIRDADLETQGLQVIRWRANLALYEIGRSCCAKAPGTG